MDADPAAPRRRIHVDGFGVVGFVAGIFIAKYVSGGDASWVWLLLGAFVGFVAGIVWYWWLLPRRFPRFDPETGTKSRLSFGAAFLTAVLLWLWLSDGAFGVVIAGCGGWLLPRGLRPIYDPPLR